MTDRYTPPRVFRGLHILLPRAPVEAPAGEYTSRATRTEMGVDVQEVVARWLFEGQHVQTVTSQDVYSPVLRSVGVWLHDDERVETMDWQAKWVDKRLTTRCSVGAEVQRFALVGPAWQAAYKAWLASETERATEAWWELAVAAGLGLCRRSAYRQNPPWSTGLGLALVFEGGPAHDDRGATRPMASVVFVRQGNADKHALTAQATTGRSETKGPWWGAAVHRAAWHPWFGAEGTALKREFEAWEAAQTAALGAWVRGC